MPTRRRTPRVALLIETTRTYTRELLAGVRRYIAAHGPWSTFLELRALDSSPPAWLRDWDGDGILTRTFTPQMGRLIEATGLPAIELRTTNFGGSRPYVGMDNRLIGASVAEHFLERGYRQFAAYSLHTESFFVERIRNFVTTVEALGARCSRLPETTSDSAKDWEKSQARLVAWLQELPKPVGIFAANDQLGVRLLEACQRAGVAVPEEVAVVGAENEETLCSFATPPLTSVRYDGQAVGYAAAEMLDQLMRGRRLRRSAVLIPPKGIVVRHSSDSLVINDPFVAHAARLIREEALHGLNVDQLCHKLNASRSTLDRRMKAALQRTPKEEILRVRFREVERLLRETDLTIDTIAAQTGFAHSHYLQAAFKETHGVTPGAWRRVQI
ncbi:transcriptional regulator, AraC family [Chthoniobacter flavus Ellin428]|uniref:Transcriptional regulator, AraC family n=1 Tax=Chthoniobacter flavus Ellin428 TaxID=497964 RepID=B4D2S2_9BACT|nr:DNA-binding transcriptional regulator [Chthoniobacter flavus]EDY19033.1 transcriptional regulator, AraC family [Chthoniobacter flavus Ellin428]TCO86796.1 AraC family transcriptional regulator [Chthoniobacter flavus]